MKLVYVEWEDHASIGNGWRKKEDALEETPRLVKEVGWVLKEDKKYLSIVATLDLDDKESEFVSDGIVIIKTCIRKKLDLTKYIK